MCVKATPIMSNCADQSEREVASLVRRRSLDGSSKYRCRSNLPLIHCQRSALLPTLAAFSWCARCTAPPREGLARPPARGALSERGTSADTTGACAESRTSLPLDHATISWSWKPRQLRGMGRRLIAHCGSYAVSVSNLLHNLATMSYHV